MKRKGIILIVLLATLALTTSCKRTCRCYHFNGSIVEYSEEALDEIGVVCTQMAGSAYNYGLTYSDCSWTY